MRPLFFVGYVLFEVPSNLYMKKVGARVTVMRIMILWGAITVATGFVTSPAQLHVLRFLLGAAEAGFFPCIILYLTYWFPAARRARITGLFVLAVPAAGIISGPLSTAIMRHTQGDFGLQGWQLLFVYEGIPAIVLGVVAWFVLANGPRTAKWLTERERQLITSELDVERAALESTKRKGGTVRQILSDRRLYIAAFVFFAMYAAFSTYSYWTPTFLKGLGVENITTIGNLTAIPALGAVLGMLVISRSSDRRLERRFHIAIPLALSALCFAGLVLTQHSLVWSMVLLTVAATFAFGTLPVFWSVPPAYLAPATAAGGIAVISSMGGVAAAITPNVIGRLTTNTGNMYSSLIVLAVLMGIAAVVMVVGIPAKALKERSAKTSVPSEK